MTDLMECKYRRYTRRPGLLRLHCFLKRADCTQEECKECQYLTPEGGQRAIVFDEITEPGYFQETPDPNRLAVNIEDRRTWIVEHTKIVRPDLQAIRVSLPRHRPGKDRKFIIESDGVIVYEQEEGNWEPPKDIQGYQRDSENPWRFVPLWLKCLKRIPKGKRSKGCGCIQIEMFCDNDEVDLHKQKVTYQQCQFCERRIE